MNVARETCDLIVHNAHLVTMDDRRRMVRNGAVAIRGSRIVAVGAEREVLEHYGPGAARKIDAQGALVHPGLIEPHLHITQHTSRGALSVFLAPGATLRYAEWKANLRPEDEIAATAHSCLELIQAGYTSFVEPGTAFAPDAVAETVAEIGMRAWLTDAYLWDRDETLQLYPTLTSPALLERVPCDFDRCLRDLGSQLFRNDDPDALVRGYVGLYGESTASDELQVAAKQCAADHGVTFAQHVGFAPEIAVAEHARLGCTTVRHMADLGIMDGDSTFIHMNIIEDDDVATIVESGLAIIWCAANYLFVAAPSGVRTRLPELHRMGTPVGLGIDGPGNCAFGDAPAIAYNAARQAGTWVTGPELLEMQTVAAAKTIGFDAQIGSLEPGKRADLVIRRADTLQGLGFDPAFELALFERASSVDTVLINGQVVLENGHFTTADPGAVVDAARASMHRIVDRIGMRRAHGWPLV